MSKLICRPVLSKFNTWLRVRGSALRLAIAPEFSVFCSYMRVFTITTISNSFCFRLIQVIQFMAISIFITSIHGSIKKQNTGLFRKHSKSWLSGLVLENRTAADFLQSSMLFTAAVQYCNMIESFLSYTRSKKSLFQACQRGKTSLSSTARYCSIIVASWRLLAATVPSWCFLWTTAQRQQHQSVVRQSNIDLQASPSEDASVACQCQFRSWLWLVTD